MTNAEATVRFAILNAVCETAMETGLRAGGPSEGLVDEIICQLSSPTLKWATIAWAKELSNEQEQMT